MFVNCYYLKLSLVEASEPLIIWVYYPLRFSHDACGISNKHLLLEQDSVGGIWEKHIPLWQDGVDSIWD